MSQSERHDLDDAIDRAARQLVMHEPSPRLYAAVMAGIEARNVRRTASAPAWWTWRWAISGMAAAALVAVTASVLVWHSQTQRPAALPALPAPPQMARIAPVAPQALSPPPLPARRDVVPIVEPRPEANDAERIQVATIAVADIPVDDISVSTIRVTDIAGDDPISINTIGADKQEDR